MDPDEETFLEETQSVKTSLCFRYVGTSARAPKAEEAAPTHRDSDLAQNVLRYGHVFLDNLFVKLVQRSVHQLHTDPHIALATHTWETPRSMVK